MFCPGTTYVMQEIQVDDVITNVCEEAYYVWKDKKGWVKQRSGQSKRSESEEQELQTD